jgi:hypothetical protein
MRRLVLLTALTALILGVLPAGAQTDEATPVDCGPGDGRERLTPAGFTAELEAPVVPAPLLAATAEQTAAVQPYRRAVYAFTADFTPADGGTIAAALSWTDGDPSDYDVFIVDAEGNELGRSAEFNQTGPYREEATAFVEHCQDFSIAITNFAGRPLGDLAFAVTVTPNEEAQLACAEGDPAPGCAGKAAGEAPAPVADTRTRLYLGGDPGQASMVHAFAANDDLPQATLDPQRPTSGTPNSYTRPVVGFRDRYRNPFVPHFTAAFDEPVDLVGEATALVWVSSPTLDQGGTLFVDLYADGGLLSSVQIPGAEVGTAPTPLLVRFPDLDAPEALSVTLQLGTTPAVSSNGPGNPGDALFTVHYGGVQFPSRVTLPS